MTTRKAIAIYRAVFPMPKMPRRSANKQNVLEK